MSLEADVLRKYRRIVVVGATSDPEKPSNFVWVLRQSGCSPGLRTRTPLNAPERPGWRW